MAKKSNSDDDIHNLGDYSLFYVSTENKMKKACEMLLDQKWVAVDTEFIYVKEFHSRLSLIQIATAEPKMIYIFDCIQLKMPYLMLFDQILCNASILKVFHACKADTVLLHSISGKLVNPIFDTQEAYGFLTCASSIGYKRLVEIYCDVTLDKSSSTSDWGQRPLADTQLFYAANDVKYLSQIYPIMVSQLESEKRLGWVKNRFDFLVSHPLRVNEWHWLFLDISQDWLPEQWAMIHLLCAWRWHTATMINRPLTFVLSNEEIINISASPQTAIWRSSRNRVQFWGFLSAHQEYFQHTLQRHQSLYPISSHLDEILARFRETIRARSVEMGVASTAIASLKEQLLLIFGDPYVVQLFSDPKQYWKNLIGDHLFAILLEYQPCHTRPGVQ